MSKLPQHRRLDPRIAVNGRLRVGLVVVVVWEAALCRPASHFCCTLCGTLIYVMTRDPINMQPLACRYFLVSPLDESTQDLLVR
jgi:hypothetical protein